MQPGLEPDVMSLSADLPVEYKKGLRNPSGLLPAALSWSLRSAMTDAKMGEEHDVPATVPVWPPTMISTFSPCAETSGNARPLVLNLPEFIVPSAVRYVETTDDW